MENRYKEAYTNEQGYTFYIDKILTEWANHREEDNLYVVYLVKFGDIEESKLLCNNKKHQVIAELPLSESIEQACARIDVYKVWSKDDLQTNL
jgi:hypothetical protein